MSLPIAATDVAVMWDHLYWFLVWLSVFFFVLVVGTMIYFVIKYRHQKKQKPVFITGNHTLEVIWSIVPLLLVLIVFVWGYVVYRKMIHAPPNSLEVRVIGKQWLWQFQYEDGKTTVNELFVPVNQPVKLIMSSEDVIHSFFVPDFRVKQDVVPGMYTSIWFEPTVPGRHQIFCAEYCGTSHSQMLADLYVLSEGDWAQWKAGKKLNLKTSRISMSNVPSPTLAEQGKKLMLQKGCVACHSDDGSPRPGPTYKNLFNSKVELANGQVVIADENYLRESIETPQAKLVKGFGPLMPTFRGIVSEEEINAIIAYIKSLK
ncbi:MAG: cytochrome c oxidase subunit II [Bdellovibrio sp.]|nr:cytochrome c oxidase subunit II [Bdellovibrio sp.]